MVIGLLGYLGYLGLGLLWWQMPDMEDRGARFHMTTRKRKNEMGDGGWEIRQGLGIKTGHVGVIG